MWLLLHLTRAFKPWGEPSCWPRKETCHWLNVLTSLYKTHRKHPFTDLVTSHNCQLYTCRVVHGAQLTMRSLKVAPWTRDKCARGQLLSLRHLSAASAIKVSLLLFLGKVLDMDGCLCTQVLYMLHLIHHDLDWFALPSMKFPEVGQRWKTL